MLLTGRGNNEGWFDRLMIKKNGWIVFVVMIMVFTLTACGGNSGDNKNAGETASVNTLAAGEEEAFLPEPDAKKLIVWTSGMEQALVHEAGEVFKAKYGIDIEFQEVGASGSFERMSLEGPAGVGADVFMGIHDQIRMGTNTGIILPNDYHEEETRAANNPIANEAMTVDGLLYGYPLSVETFGIYYNKDLVPNGVAPANWDDIIAFAKEFNDDSNETKYAFMWQMGDLYWSWPFFSGYGAYIFGDNGNDVTDIGLNSDAAVEAAKFYQSLKAILPVSSADVNPEIRVGLFTSGRLAMNVSGPLQANVFKNEVKNVGLMEFPKLPNGKTMKPFSSVKGFYVSANSKYPNASKLFAQLITSEEFQLRNYELFGNLPTNIAVAKNEKITSDEFAATFLNIFESSVPMPKAPEMITLWNTHEATFSSLWDKQADAKTTLDNWVEDIKYAISIMDN